MAGSKPKRHKSQRFDKDTRGTVWIYTTRDLARRFALAAELEGLSVSALGADLVEDFLEGYFEGETFEERLPRLMEENKEALARLASHDTKGNDDA